MKHVAVGILRRDGLVLACQRKKTTRYPLKWEFPGGKIEQGETAEQALARELREELDIDAEVGPLFHQQSWTYGSDGGGGNGDVFDVSYFLVSSFTGTLVNRTFESIRWVAPANLLVMDILEGNRDAVELLVRHDTVPPQTTRIPR